MRGTLRLAWGITGAGYLLRETFEVMGQLRQRGAEVTALLSRAGVEVVRMYGLWRELERICPGGYCREILTEASEGSSSIRAGRLARGVYDALVVSPASANTVAKLVHGIADTLVTNAVAQAMKGGTPVYVVPTDFEEGTIETVLPCRIDRDRCKDCRPCPAYLACPRSAIVLGVPTSIDLKRCNGCGRCVQACPERAIRIGETIKVRVRKIDAENVRKLAAVEGVTVLRHPRQILEALERIGPRP